MARLKTDLWKKAYLIEFMSEDGIMYDAFTFSVPPESEEITYSQRKSETKTFGGLHVDDYGLDAVKISLSGSTINQDLKRIYNPQKSGADDWKTGEQEIYLLRDLIQKYKGDNRTKDIRIMLYDLSKTDKGKVSNSGSGSYIKNYWRVFPGDFKIRRASDKPFTYKYSIEFTAVDHDEERNFNLSKNKWEWVKGVIDRVKGILEEIKKAITENFVIKKMKEIKEFLDDVNSNLRNLTSLIDIAADLINSPMVYAETLLGTANSMYTILNIPRDTTQKSLNLGLEIMNSGLKFSKSVESLSYEIQDALESVYNDQKEYFFPQELLGQYSMTKEEYKDTWKSILRDLEDGANNAASWTKGGNIPDMLPLGNQDPEAGEPGSSAAYGDQNTPPNSSETGEMKLVLVYGDQEITLKETDTFESLSNEFYGNPDNAIVIAMYNGIASIDDLNPGDTIKIPMLTPSAQYLLNRIYARPGDRDNYGRDIYLDAEGNTAASTTGDFKLTEGQNNLAQAILLRLHESVVKRIRLNSYGIRTNISDPVAGVAYILSSIDFTVSADPRVNSVDNIRFSGKGDSLIVFVEYSDINNARGNVAGSI